MVPHLTDTFYNIYMDDNFRIRKTHINSGISLSRPVYVNALLYTDDTVIIENTEDKLKNAVFILRNIVNS